MHSRTLRIVAIAFTLLFVVSCSDSADTEQPHVAVATQAMSQAGPPGDQFVVVLTPGTDSRRAARAVGRSQGVQIGHVYTHALRGFTFRGSENAAMRLLERPDVVAVDRDQPIGLAQQTIPTGVDRVNADANTTAAIDGYDQRVDADIAVLDTGVDASHPDLNVFQRIDCVGGGGCAPGGVDNHGHGTHVSGTAAALDNGIGVVGVAPGARIHAIKVIEPGVYASIGDVIAGLDWVTANAPEVDVINMSLGGSGCVTGFQTAIQSVVNSGVYVAAAAGNNGTDIAGNGTWGDCDDTIPAAYPEVAAIAAMVDTDGASGGLGASNYYGDDDSFASYSNYTDYDHASNPVNSPGGAIDLLLPGTNIYSTCLDGYCAKSGTSMSSPHAAGLAALHYATFGDAVDAAGVYGVRQALIDSAAAQTDADGLAVLDDPDTNPEPVGLASLSDSSDDSSTEPDPTTTPELTPSAQSAPAGPSQTVTYEYSLCNAGNSLGSYSAVTAASWSSSVSPTLVSDLNAGACTTLKVAHTVPSTAADGSSDQGTLTVDSGAELASATFETTADAPSWAVSLDPTQQMGFGAAGDTLSYDFTVCNGGNRTDSYSLTISSSWSAGVSPTQTADLSPGSCQYATVTHTLPADGQDGDLDSGVLTVASSNASATATFESTIEAPSTEPDPLSVTDMTPGTVSAGNSLEVSITGTGFSPGITAEFTNGKGPAPRVQSLSIVDANTISAIVSTKSGGPGGSHAFDLVLTDATGASVVLPGALSVTR